MLRRQQLSQLYAATTAFVSKYLCEGRHIERSFECRLFLLNLLGYVANLYTQFCHGCRLWLCCYPRYRYKENKEMKYVKKVFKTPSLFS